MILFQLFFISVEYLGPVMSLCLEKRGVEESTKYIDNDRIMIQFVFPLNEIIIDFHDTLKSITSGYASFDYEDNGYVETDIVKLSVLLNGLCVEELSTIVHYSRAAEVAKHMATKLVNIIPRQQFQIAIQITVGSKILARETLKPFRKDITGKLVINFVLYFFSVNNNNIFVGLLVYCCVIYLIVYYRNLVVIFNDEENYFNNKLKAKRSYE